MNLILLEQADFVASNRVELRGRRLRHLREVHRVKPGDVRTVGRRGGLLGQGTVVAIDEQRALLEVTLDQEPPPRLAVRLLVALPRPKVLRRVLQAAAAFGVERLILMNGWRVEKSFWKSKALEEAAIRRELDLGLEQGRDTIPPAVERKRLLRPFVENELPELARGSTRLLAHPGATVPCPPRIEGPITLALGPEGGFIEREIELFQRGGFTPVSLGPRPLRVEQALSAFCGRWTV